MKKCDICGNEIPESARLLGLHNDIRTEEIKHVCRKCLNLVCESRKKISKLSDSLLRRWIVRLQCALDKKRNTVVRKEVQEHEL